MHKANIFLATILGLMFAGLSNESRGQSIPCDSVIFADDFEQGPGNWTVDNGLWQIGNSTVVPAHSPSNLAGTLLNQRIPNDTYTTHLISRIVSLPLISTNQELRLRYWSWFNRENLVRVSVHIKVDTGGGNFNAWTRITPEYSVVNSPWSHSSVELTRYAGRRIIIGFAFRAVYDFYNPAGGWGWYIDDVKVVITVASVAVPFAWDFEQESNACLTYHEKWWSENFLWQFGSSSVVPPYSDSTDAGSVLNGNIPNDTYTSRLVSPPILLPIQAGSQGLRLRFGYSFFRENNVNATVNVAVDSGGGRWRDFSSFASIAGPYTTNTSWTRPWITLPSSYHGKRIQFGFSVNAVYDFYNPAGGRGLYIDDVDIFDPDSIPQTPIIFALVRDSLGRSTRPVLRWHLAAGADLYRIQLSLDTSFASTVRDSTIQYTSWKVQPPIPTDRSVYYRVRAINTVGSSRWSNPIGRIIITGVSDLTQPTPDHYALFQNFPNPFNPETKINFQIPNSSEVTLKVFDLLGKEVATLVNEELKPGSYETTLGGNNLASGVYFYRLQAGNFVETKKLVLLR